MRPHLPPQAGKAGEGEREKAEESYWRLSKYGSILGGGAAALAVVLASLAYCETREQTYVLDQRLRPWISVSMTKTGPVSFDGNGRVAINVGLEMTNVGHDPAPAVGVYYDVVAVPVGAPAYEGEQALCRSERDLGRLLAGHLMFPNEKYQRPIGPEYVAGASLARISPSTNAGRFWIMIVGCATYRMRNDHEAHQTPIIYRLSKSDPSGGMASRPFQLGNGVVPTEDLRLDEVFVNGVGPT